ncbi:PRTRC system ThiF family protein [Flavobacterium subsaxonicum]|uniref:Thiamine biosynthesis protein ThiF n=1 Tax=Flavobacterium subsaxonicum WB 4.1-42 = DSM 21790 TaxID=1121898 RepID=A0A0A2MMU2_9FLAO|nr:PRTRC system ThiF family protein [Flavobacterium subsaxonicum]KGO93619.1 thiamine biosynthesis protein ThiF [Flavobacterium subsaxonicum WB 4.1-42 = DSM 21790]
MKPQTAMHYADNYLINPTNPITVNLLGAGGTGSHVLTALSKMNYSLVALGHAGLHVTVYDADTVTQANKGRQLFADSEVGMYKSVALVNRINRFFGTNWKAVARPFTRKLLRQLPNRGRANIYISCVDTVAARLDIAAALQDNSGSFFAERDRGIYWMDMGNAQKTGQVILSTIGAIQQPESKLYRTVPYLPTVTDEFREQLEAQADNSEPSCSLAEALEKQDLFINPALADLGGSLLWNLFRNGMTAYRGFFLNLADFRSMPIMVG